MNIYIFEIKSLNFFGYEYNILNFDVDNEYDAVIFKNIIQLVHCYIGVFKFIKRELVVLLCY